MHTGGLNALHLHTAASSFTREELHIGKPCTQTRYPPDWQRKSSPKNQREEEKAKGREATARPPNSETPKSQ